MDNQKVARSFSLRRAIGKESVEVVAWDSPTARNETMLECKSEQSTGVKRNLLDFHTLRFEVLIVVASWLGLMAYYCSLRSTEYVKASVDASSLSPCKFS